MTIQRMQSNGADRGTWSTPRWLFDRYMARYAFTVDLAASEHNAKCVSFITEETDSLHPETSWVGRGWLNPPYRRILPWVQKALLQTCSSEPTLELVCMLLPVRTSTTWFHDYVRPFACVEWLRDRVAFDPPQGWTGKKDSPTEDSMIAVFERVWRPRAHRSRKAV